MAPQTSQILQLAEEVSHLSRAIVDHIKATGQEEPTFDVNSPQIDEDKIYTAIKASLNEAANDLTGLVNGPKAFLRTFLVTHYELAAYQTALEFKFFQAIPIDSTKSGAEIAEITGMDEDRVCMIVRLLATRRVFVEVRPDIFAHTAISAVLAKDPEVNAAASMQMDEMFRAASEMSTCVRNAPHESDAAHSPFATRFGVPVFSFYEKNLEKGARFAQAMAGVSQMDRQFSELCQEYDWEGLGNGKICDVGGGSGHVSMYLARQFPNLSFVVQDVSQDMLNQSASLKTSDLAGRVSFMQHNFFQEQPVHDADAYFIRQCIHNWNDRDCVTILRAFVPALEKCKPGTPLLINDTVLPAWKSKTRFEEHGLRQLDLAMLVVLGAKQRTEKEFRELLKKADERFVIHKFHGDNSMGLLEVHLQK